MHGEVIEESGRRQYNLEIRLRGMSSLNIEHCGPGRSFDISVVVCNSLSLSLSLKILKDAASITHKHIYVV